LAVTSRILPITNWIFSPLDHEQVMVMGEHSTINRNKLIRRSSRALALRPPLEPPTSGDNV